MDEKSYNDQDTIKDTIKGSHYNEGESKHIESDNFSGDEINNFIMDNKGNIRRSGTNGTAVLASPRTFIALGWISAALTLLISPYFAAAGITFGLLANRQARGSGNYIIIANVALALINFVFGLFLAVALRRMILGY